MREAMYYKKIENNTVICQLCPHNCRIGDGKRGFCNVRINIEGELFTENYGKLSALNIDPIEKKPLYHFFPGNSILSIGTYSCNMRCTYCQNWEISQIKDKNLDNVREYSVKEITNILKQKESLGLAYTYNEPFVWYEYMLDLAREVKQLGLKNVVVTNGYINREPLLELLPYIDGFSVDLKAFTDSFYKKITGARLEAVKETLLLLKENNKYFEIDFLVIPGLNDNIFEFKEMVAWIKERLGEDTVLHINRYFPNYKMAIEVGRIQKLELLYELANQSLNYVYIGNVSMDQDTYCPSCKKKLIERSAFKVDRIGIDSDGKCKYCLHQVIEEDRI